jgi:hypothetical protein
MKDGLRIQLEIVGEHAAEHGLKSGPGVVRSVIEEIERLEALLEKAKAILGDSP